MFGGDSHGFVIRSLEGYSWEEFSPSLATLTLRLVVAIWKDLHDAFACHPLGALEFGIGLECPTEQWVEKFPYKRFQGEYANEKIIIHAYIHCISLCQNAALRNILTNVKLRWSSEGIYQPNNLSSSWSTLSDMGSQTLRFRPPAEACNTAGWFGFTTFAMNVDHVRFLAGDFDCMSSLEKKHTQYISYNK